MSALFPDTQPEAEHVLIGLLREAPPWRKAAMVGQLNRAVRGLALVGLRERHPAAHPAELRYLLAELLLGPEAAAIVKDALGEWGPMPAGEPIAVTLLVVDVLDRLGVPYLIGGSLASAMYGVARTTIDADLVADLRPEHAARFVEALSGAFYVNAVSVHDAIRRRDSFNVIHLESMFKVDVFIPKARAFDQSQLDRRVAQVVEGESERTAYVATAEDTVLAKLEWYRQGGGVSERQWRDVLGVLSVQKGRLDLAYLQHWATALDIADLLERALLAVNL